MWVNGSIGPRWISPSNYLKQFHPKYNSEYTDFVEHDRKRNEQNNPECPSLNPWHLVAYEQGVSSTYDRNPYYYCVDTDGNQLPYIDGIDDKPSPLSTSANPAGQHYWKYTPTSLPGRHCPLKEVKRIGYGGGFWIPVPARADVFLEPAQDDRSERMQSQAIIFVRRPHHPAHRVLRYWYLDHRHDEPQGVRVQLQR
jgi:hypothetical protein